VSWTVPIADGLSLSLASEAAPAGGVGAPPAGAGLGAAYPTMRLRRGLLLLDGGVDLSEEGVGFGVPVVRRGHETVFAGTLEVLEQRTGAHPRLVARYSLDLAERLRDADGGLVDRRGLYRVKDALAALHRRAPALRGSLGAASSLLRAGLGWTTVYEHARAAGSVVVACEVDPSAGLLTVDVDLAGLAPDVDEAVAMNEQGARCFDRYVEDGGVLRDATGVATWDLVRAQRAAFVGAGRVAFWAAAADGAHLYRGRELVGARLAWAGFGYSAPPALGHLRYRMTVERLAEKPDTGPAQQGGRSRRGGPS
jgi:hypothetical protein